MIKEGITLLNEVKQTGIDSELLETGLGDGYRNAGDLASAERHYKRAIAIFEQHPGAHLGLALVAFSKGDEATGLDHWRQFIEYEKSAGKSGRSLF